MRKQIIKPAWLLFVIFQAFFGSCVGLFALSGHHMESVPTGTYIAEINIGGMDYQEARNRLMDYNDIFTSKGRIEITVNEDRHNISYNQIDARLDVDKTLDAVFNELTASALRSFIAGESAQSVYDPVLVFNKGKLMAEAEKIFSQYGREPVPESYRIENGQLIYSSEVSGIRIDYAALEHRISQHIQSLSQETLALSSDDHELFIAFDPIYDNGRESFMHIVSSSRIHLGKPDPEEVERILEGLNGNVVPSGEQIQLSAMIDLDHRGQEGKRDLVNRAATAVYQAFLPIKGITPLNRRSSTIALPYSEPGLEAVIEGENGDLVLENATGQPLMLLCETQNEFLHCYVVTPEQVPSGVLVAQKKEIMAPPVVYTVNSDLKKGEKVVVSEGREGFTIYVERIIGNDRETLYTDRYDPVGSVVEIGDNPLQTGSK